MKEPIGVLCGGPSREREISLRSGRAVQEALAAQGLDAFLFPLSQELHQIADELNGRSMGSAFIALHGPFGEDGTIQALLEEKGIPYTGSGVEACRYGTDKVHSRRRWLAAGLPVPEWRQGDPDSLLARMREFRYPLMLKPRAEGSSLGMSIVDGPEDLPTALREAEEFGPDLLLEEYLPGKELTVGILQDRPLPVIQIVPKRRFYDYVAKYTPGMTDYLVPAPLTDRMARIVQDIALRAHEALGCRSFSRVDLILVEGRGPVLLELNPIPGLTETSLLPKAAAAAGVSFGELCRLMLISSVPVEAPA